jgi:hypothetical protein
MGFFYWGEVNNPKNQKLPRNAPKGARVGGYRKPNYHKAEKRWIDPHEVTWASTPLNEKAVQAYEENPDRWSDDGDPFVVVNEHGVVEGWNGKHRAVAAMRRGRKLKVRYWDVRGNEISW